MSTTPIENCANCDRPIGRLETPFLFKDTVVCSQCHGILSPDIPYATPASLGKPAAIEHALYDNRPAVAPMARACPSCGSCEPAVKKAKGSSLLLILLLLLWVLPGLIYLIVYNGYVYVCPRCGYKFGDAT